MVKRKLVVSYQKALNKILSKYLDNEKLKNDLKQQMKEAKQGAKAKDIPEDKMLDYITNVAGYMQEVQMLNEEYLIHFYKNEFVNLDDMEMEEYKKLLNKAKEQFEQTIRRK